MADNNNSSKKGWLSQVIDDGFDDAKTVVHITGKRLLNPVYLALIGSILWWVNGCTTIFGNGTSGFIGWEKEGIATHERLGQKSYEAGSYLRNVTDEHKVNISIEYVGNSADRRNSREFRDIRLDDLNSGGRDGDQRVMSVRNGQ